MKVCIAQEKEKKNATIFIKNKGSGVIQWKEILLEPRRHQHVVVNKTMASVRKRCVAGGNVTKSGP